MLNPKHKVLNRDKEAKTNDAKAKTRARYYANERRHAKSSKLVAIVGDKVIIKQRKGNKFTTNFELIESCTVTERKGTKIVAHTITRNASFFKRISNAFISENDWPTSDHDHLVALLIFCPQGRCRKRFNIRKAKGSNVIYLCAFSPIIKMTGRLQEISKSF